MDGGMIGIVQQKETGNLKENISGKKRKDDCYVILYKEVLYNE